MPRTAMDMILGTTTVGKPGELGKTAIKDGE